MTKSNRGGPRKGAGRKAKDGATDLEKIDLYLDPITIDKFSKQGNGNISLGARDAAKLLGIEKK